MSPSPFFYHPYERRRKNIIKTGKTRPGKTSRPESSPVFQRYALSLMSRFR
ncbi:hypothetical protein HMPREF0083_04914 [Aneurinibacillus aneurinilyticus ATCC 12856]|uniref:Uncharacterized protein n=1 Tax=Aneurinibacillus aneurinilyticus ATCC 12856 TaxID=649747 RepID=U1Y4A4_ANEAE|nr:hypothetical protein HMPREF0083_04914 [Aneurinibacillus aneurinilyticus ATCC 12856]